MRLSRALAGLLQIALVFAAPCASAQTVLMITAANTPNAEETARVNQLQTWGYTVHTIADSTSQLALDAAVGAVDVVYVPCTIDDWDLLYKLRTAGKGVVTETPGLDTEFGFATADGYIQTTAMVEGVDNSHAVTAGLAAGNVTIANSAQNLALNSNPSAPGMQVLGTLNWGQMSLGVIEAGGMLANTYNGNSTASGRRVRLPWGWAISFGSLNSNGLTLLNNALEWAAAKRLLLHYKLDHSSGSTVTDSSGNNYTGAVTGTATWVPAVRGNGFAFNGNSKITVESELGAPTNVSMAAWVDLDAVDSQGSDIISIGDHVVLRLTSDAVQVHLYNGSTWHTTAANFSPIGKGWHHYACTFDDAADKLSIYIDGQLATTATVTTTISYSGLGNATVIGRHGDGKTTMDLVGRVDDVRIYGYALTHAEIAVIYGLVGHYKLDEKSGTSVADASGAGNAGTVAGTPGWTAAVKSNGHRFKYTDGDDYITIANSASLQDLQEEDYSIALWFKPASVPPGSGYSNDAAYGLVMKNSVPAGLGYTYAQKFGISHPFADGSILMAESENTFAPGSYHHVIAVVKRSAGTLTLYVNGQIEATHTFTPHKVAHEHGTATWKLGINNPGAGSYRLAADGTLDDVRLYNRALTHEEIDKLYGTRGHWKFDEATGTVAADSSTARLDGTYVNAPSLGHEGVYGTAAHFNHASSPNYVSLPSAAITGATTVSVSFWIKTEHTGEQAVLSGNNASQDNEFLLHFGSHTEFRTYCHGAPQSWTIPSIADGQWHHFVVVSSSADHQTTVYINGVSFGSRTVSANGTPFNIAPGGLIVAQEQDSVGGGFQPSQCFRGMIDDLRLYERSLTSQEIAQLYGMVRRWKFNEGAGSMAGESTGLGSSANITGATWTSDCSGNMALCFDGLNDSAATAGSFDPPSKGAVAFWFRSAGPVAAPQRLWGIGTDFEMWQDADGLLYCDVATDAYQGGLISESRLDTEDRWYHVVAEYDADTDAYAIYLDGELHKAGISVQDIIKQSAGTLTFGTRAGTGDYFQGAMRDFRVYDRKMTAREIAEHSGLMARWRLDETSGTVAHDSAAAGNGAVYVGGPTLGASSTNTANGTAVEFNGTSQYVTAGKSLLNGISRFTISAWVRPDSVAPVKSFLGQHGVIEFGIDTSSNHIDLWTQHGGTLSVDHPLAIAKWTHVAAVGDGTGLNIYINGKHVGSGGSPSVHYGTSSAAFKIGEGVLTASGNYFDGRMDDVRVYSRALCPAEVADIYQGGRPSGVRIIRWVETR